MPQITMYPAQVNSPQTELSESIGATDVTIPVINASLLPAAPNLLVIGTDESAETIRYTGKSGNTLTGVIRGVEGTAKNWNAGSKIARNFTAADYEAMRANISDASGSAETAKSSVAAHIADNGNPHGVTKAQVGLGNVDNYATASQAQAEAGAASDKLMTPQRTKQYVDKRLLNNLLFRLNNGTVEYSSDSGGTWKPLSALFSTKYKGSFSHSVQNAYATALSISGPGRLVAAYLTGNLVNSSSGGKVTVIVDGVTIIADAAFTQNTGSHLSPLGSFSTTYAEADISFKESLVIQIAPTVSTTATIGWIYELLA